MTKIAYKFFLNQEINRVNRMIDQKIKAKKPYRRESRIHKNLVAKLNRLQNKKRKQSPVLLFA